MKVKYSKKIDSSRLKANLDKAKSIEDAKRFSLSVKPGPNNTSCPICTDSKNVSLQTVYGFEYRQCKNCDAVYVSNAPCAGDVEKIYTQGHYEQGGTGFSVNDEAIDYRLKYIAAPKAKHIFENLTTQKRAWLDIGCGTGEILNVVLKKGWVALGIEANGLKQKYAIEKFKVNIVNDYINETNISRYAGKYGVISLFGVLEHVFSPHSVIEGMSSCQQAGDNLVIEVPHFPSISAICQIAFPDMVNRIMHPPLHLFLFSLKSLEILLKRYNYEILHVWYYGQDVFEFLTTFALRLDGFKTSLLYEKLSSLTNDFQRAVDMHAFSDEILIIAKKNSSSSSSKDTEYLNVDKFLSGDKIYLRKLTKADCGPRYLSFVNDMELVCFVEGLGHKELTKEELIEYVKSCDNPTSLLLGIFENGTDVHVGNIHLSQIKPDHGSCVYGIVLSREHMDRGYASQASRLLARHAFENMGINRIQINVVEANKRAVRLYEKLGAVYEGRLKEAFCLKDKYHDVIVYALLKSK